MTRTKVLECHPPGYHSQFLVKDIENYGLLKLSQAGLDYLAKPTLT